MPRGGKQEPDGYSPFKTADGRELKLLKSSKSQTGYFRVVKIRKLYYPKLKLDDVKGSKSQKVFGKGRASAREAATVLAEYLAAPYELPSAPRTLTVQQQHEKNLKRVAELHAEACRLLDMPNHLAECELEEEGDSDQPLRAPARLFDGPALLFAEFA